MTDAGVHMEVQVMYARQMRLYDEGAYSRWAATFTPDATFDIDLLPEPLQGREAIARAALRLRAELGRADVQHRTWMGMPTVELRNERTVFARSYAMVLAVPRGGRAELRHTTVCEDVLVRAGRVDWLVQDRYVIRDAVG